MILVYTAIFGGCDSLKPAPVGIGRCVCFTDHDQPNPRGWEIVRREVGDRGRRAARVLKMTPAEWFPDAEASIWVDGSIEIRDGEALIRAVALANAQIACFPHPDRASCYDEGRTVVRLKIAHQAKVMAALEIYKREGFEPTSLSTTGLLYRRHTPEVAAFCQLWRDHLDTYGTNDQVHVDYCAWKAGVPISYLPGHYRDNPYTKYDQADHHRRRKPQFKLEQDCAHYLA